MVFASALIMLNQVMPPVIFRYRDHIKKLVTTYGENCWAIIYQADVRMRQAHIERIRRAESHKLDEALKRNPDADTGFDPSYPWGQWF